MRKNILRICNFVAILLLGGCYSDKGSDAFMTLDDMTITFPSVSYDVAVGENLEIAPGIDTKIAEEDLIYQWEIYTRNPEEERASFLPFENGKNLDYTCSIGDLMPAIASYNIRLHVIQKSMERDFYSDVLSVSLTGVTGLMVLHGDDAKCDIGLLRATDFLLSEGTRETDNRPYWYSENNNNEKIEGVGKSIIQSLLDYQLTIYGTSDFADVVAITDKGATVCNYSALNKKGDWTAMFLIPDACENKPQAYIVNAQKAFAIDNGELYVRAAQSGNVEFQTVNISRAVANVQAYVPKNKNSFFFDKDKRAFYAIPWMSEGVHDDDLTTEGGWTQMFGVETTNGNFNMADMQADLLDLETGGASGHYMAVMKKNDGSGFLAEINYGASSTSQWDYAKYDMSALPDIAAAKFFAFGSDCVNMCYYATSSAVYNFAAYNGQSLNAEKLTDESGHVIDFGGEEITMMKVLKPVMGDRTYYNSNKILLVGTYEGTVGTGKLYSLKINQVTGLVLDTTVFTGFDKIYDASMKGI